MDGNTTRIPEHSNAVLRAIGIGGLGEVELLMKSRLLDHPSERIQVHGGDGKIGIHRPFPHQPYLPFHTEIWDLEPGESEGPHIHRDGVIETYTVLVGSAEMTVDLETTSLIEGDTVQVEPGCWHSIRNASDKHALKLMLVWGRIRQRSPVCWAGETSTDVEIHLRQTIQAAEYDRQQGFVILPKFLPTPIFRCLADGWPKDPLFSWTLAPSSRNEKNSLVIGDLNAAVTDPRWGKGADEWCSLCTVMRSQTIGKAIAQAWYSQDSSIGIVAKSGSVSLTFGAALIQGETVPSSMGAAGGLAIMVNFDDVDHDMMLCSGANTQSLITCPSNGAIIVICPPNQVSRVFCWAREMRTIRSSAFRYGFVG